MKAGITRKSELSDQIALKLWEDLPQKTIESIKACLVRLAKKKDIPESISHDMQQLQQEQLAYKPKGAIKQIPSSKDFTFKPKINIRSSALGKKFKGYEEHINDLYKSQMKSNEKINKMRQHSYREDMEKCSFSPKITVYKGPKAERKVKETKTSEEKELDLCTFKPIIHGTISQNTAPSPRDYDKAVNRIREATKAKEEYRKLREEIPRGENYQRNRNMKPKEFSFMQRIKKEKKLIMYVDILVAPGKTGRIAIKEGDNSRDLAKSFCKTFCLGKDAQSVLEKMLQEHIENFLLS